MFFHLFLYQIVDIFLNQKKKIFYYHRNMLKSKYKNWIFKQKHTKDTFLSYIIIIKVFKKKKMNLKVLQKHSTHSVPNNNCLNMKLKD